MGRDWMKRWRGCLAAGAVGTLSLTACGKGVIPKEPPAITDRASLLSFQGQNACADLETYLEDTAVNMMTTDLEASRDGVPTWGWWGGFGWRGGLEDRFSPQASAAPGGNKSAPSAYTTTNTQVAGVDEADFVKNDGTRIFALSGNKLYAARSWPAADLSVQGKLEVEGWPREMFLDEKNRLVVFSSVYRKYPIAQDIGECANSIWCGYSYANATKVTVVDVANLGALKVTHEYELPGSYFNARRVGAAVRIVTNDSFRFPNTVSWWPNEPNVNIWDPAQKPARVAAFDRLIASNAAAIRAMKLSDWLPATTVKANGLTSVLPPDCSSVARVNAPTRLGDLTVVTLNLDTPGTVNRSSVLAEAGEVYASTENLYVATRHWWWWPAPGQKDTTYIHKFDISQPDRARYVASGKVDGHIVNQFSLDESAAGHFRLATTIGQRVLDPNQPDNWWGTLQLTNRVTVMAENSGYLDPIGTSPDVAEGERITSARFIGDTAYVVTFRNVDPLFTFDLRDPTHPKKVGELKIPGFSSYMHPLDATHLLTIGTYIPEDNTQWQERRVQLSIFDVGDLANPKQTHTVTVGSAYSSSEAQWDHKAFNYFPAKKLLAIPFSDYSFNNNGGDYWSTFTSDLRVFSIDAQTGFSLKGSVSMKDMYQVFNSWNWTYYWTPQVRRSVMADDYVYAISDSGIRVSNVANLALPVQTALFDKVRDF